MLFTIVPSKPRFVLCINIQLREFSFNFLNCITRLWYIYFGNVHLTCLSGTGGRIDSTEAFLCKVPSFVYKKIKKELRGSYVRPYRFYRVGFRIANRCRKNIEKTHLCGYASYLASCFLLSASSIRLARSLILALHSLISVVVAYNWDSKMHVLHQQYLLLIHLIRSRSVGTIKA